MSTHTFSELAFLSYCDVSYAGARVLIEAVEWHKAQRHAVVSENLNIVTECSSPCVALPSLPSAAITVSTVSISGRATASCALPLPSSSASVRNVSRRYAIVHCALLRSHAAAVAAGVVSALAQRGCRRVFLISAVHQPLFAGLSFKVRQWFLCVSVSHVPVTDAER